MQAHDDPELRQQVRATLLYPAKPSWQQDAVRWHSCYGWPLPVIANRCNRRISEVREVIQEAKRAQAQ